MHKAAVRPVRQPRPLTERQSRKLMVATLGEITTLSAAYQLNADQIRGRLLVLQHQVRNMLHRWPDPDRQIPQNRWARRLARDMSDGGALKGAERVAR